MSDDDAELACVEQLLERILESGESPEDACRACPELLPAVRAGLRQLRQLDEEFSALFPPSDSGDAGPTNALDPAELPAVPGYEVLGVLGHGGMGVVFRARHLRLNRPVALKMILSGPYAVREERERLVHEAEAVASIHHPNIVEVYDAGDIDGRPYFTMELVEGGRLSQKIAGVPRPAREAAALVEAVADAVHAAHQKGIIHRDLKPSNILLTADGTPKVTDFGLARWSDEASTTLTGSAVGTPSYMAPEQARGASREIGPATDVYALGAILYELLTGRPPFRGETSSATIQQVLTDRAVPPSRLNPRVPRDLETISLKCLHKDPARRYASAAQLADDLRRFGRGEPIVARPVGPSERCARWVRRRPALAGALAAGVLLASALVVTVLWWHLQRTTLEATAVAYAEADLTESERLRDRGEFNASAAVLQRAKDRLREFVPPELRDRLSTAVVNLELVRRLEAIRLRRSVLFNEIHSFDRAQSDRDYQEAFRSAGLGTDQEMPETVAPRVSDSPVRKALVAGLDDWASCTGDLRRRSWLLTVARLADPDPWRDRARNAPVWEDRAKLAELTDAAPVRGQPLTLLLAVGEQLQLAGGDARPFLWRVQLQHPNDFWANRALGDALYLRGEHALSVGFFRMALALRPDTAVANNELGDVLLSTGRADEAIFYLERALEIDPLSARNHIFLADALTAEGKPEAADRHYREALRLVPETILGRRSLAIALEGSGRPNEARALYEQNVQLNPRDEQCRRDLALHLARRGQMDEAAAQFRTALDINPKSVMAHADLGRLLRDMRRPDEAAAHFRAAVAINPKSVMALHDMGSLLLRTGRPHEATEYLRLGAALEPFNGLIQADLRAALIRQGQLEEARAAWQKALDAAPREHDAWFGYAELCLFLGHEDEYRRHRLDLLGRFGGSKTAAVAERTGRACLLLPAPEGEVEQAVALTERAVAASGANPFYLFAQGLARYRQGRFDDAINLMNGDAASVMGPSPRFVLAMSQYQKGQMDQAGKTLAAAIASHDWDTAKATNHDAWITHILRREAESLIRPAL